MTSNPALMAKMARSLPTPKRIKGVDRIIMVASGKGGVGKSMVSANLAVELAQRGATVGLLDADVFGPSIPALMGIEGREMEMDQDGALQPILNYGVKMASMGLLNPSRMVAWRGLMVVKVLQDLVWRVPWGPLDWLVIDTPPGTGDTHLTLLQQLIIDGGLIVTTPQPLALAATEKGIQLMREMKCPLVGVVENMKYVECEKCHHHVELFEDRTRMILEKHQLPLLASLPFLRDAIITLSSRSTPFAKIADIICREIVAAH